MENVKIGLEIHEQLMTKSKLFCGCATDYRFAEPNASVCPVCTGQPGSKPMGLNEKALAAAVRIAIALGCNIAGRAVMQRKHYFYPDLPNNYQRTSTPIGAGGGAEGVTITDVHLEEDPGRFDLRNGLVDLNRSGTPLVEITTEPAFDSPEHARRWLQKMRLILDYLGVVREEEGTMRVDANVSVAGGNRVEVKNINSFRGVEQALNFELTRQRSVMSRGGIVARETRHFEEAQGTTTPLRKKETEEDYRYMPDPDVPPLEISKELVEKIRKSMPELPAAKEARFTKQYKIQQQAASVLVSEPELAALFEDVAETVGPNRAANWLVGVLKKTLNYNDTTIRASGIGTANVSKLLKMVDGKIVTEKIAEQILREMVKKQNSRDPEKIMKGLGIPDAGIAGKRLKDVIKEIVRSQEKAVEDYKKGKKESFEFLVGLVMKGTRGAADPKAVREILQGIVSKKSKHPTN